MEAYANWIDLKKIALFRKKIMNEIEAVNKSALVA
jgi:hypothetical protein